MTVSRILFLLTLLPTCYSLTAENHPASFSLFDRFRAVCPADASCIQLFDNRLAANDNGSMWVAVYRAAGNKPSVLVRDEFFQAMRSATETINAPNLDRSVQSSFEVVTSSYSYSSSTSVQQQIPVAVARLAPSKAFAGTWELGEMRCVLKKENQNEECDGGSEHTEALCTAIDALVEAYLQSHDEFEGAIRTKATLVAAPLLEARGFCQVESLQSDMASHVSSLSACLKHYAARSEESKTPGARQKALNIVSLLGRIDREKDMKRYQERKDKNDNDSGADEYDPWAGMKQFL